MPRRLFRRLMPAQRDHNSLVARCLGPLINDPHLFHLNRHSVSGAFLVGLFCAFLPVPGQAVIAAVLALTFHYNLPISILLIWISNPITIPPLTLALYKLGQWMLGRDPALTSIEWSINWMANNLHNFYLPVLLAGICVGLATGLLGYIFVRLLWRWQVIRNWEARKRRRVQNPK